MRYRLPSTHVVYARFGAWDWTNYARSEDEAWDILCEWAADADRPPSCAQIRPVTRAQAS